MEFDPKDEELKAAVKDAIKEWIDDSVKTFGWWSIKTLAGVAICGLVYLAFIGTGHFR